ncbi:hypothetical protein LTR17_025018, partial [Elasticomyces elasticus]
MPKSRQCWEDGGRAVHNQALWDQVPCKLHSSSQLQRLMIPPASLPQDLGTTPPFEQENIKRS